ncbi:MAG: type IV pilin-like G/H family protein [Cyanobacteriota bacterium]
MKLEFQAKFLQHLNKKKKKEEGFTLIELLVVIIIIGILAAIALPSLLGQVAKAKQAEAKNNTGAVNRAQQAYYLEWQCFTTSLTDLGVGIKTATENYDYVIKGVGADTCPTTITNKATAKKPALRSYAGIVGTVVGNTETSEPLTVAFACESNSPQTDPIETANDGTTQCPAGTKDLASAKGGGT